MDAVRPPDASVEHAIIDSQVIGRGYSNHRKERHAATCGENGWRLKK